jgi:hypothetical protein
MDITYNYVPLFIDNDWSLVSIVPPNLNSQIKPQNLNTSTLSSIYDEFKIDKSSYANEISNTESLHISNKDIQKFNISNSYNDISNFNTSKNNISNNEISNNDITIAEISNTEVEKKSILDLGNLKSKNMYIDKKNVLLGFGN